MQPGDSVLITAASSSVGLAAIQIANQIGAIPIAVTRSDQKRERLLTAGAAAVIATHSEDTVKTAQKLTNGAGVDIIIDSVMGPGLAELTRAARPGGSLVIVGWLDPRPASFPTTAPLTIHRYVGFAHIVDPLVVRRISAFLAAGVRSGVTSPVIDSVFHLDRVVDAHHRIEEGQHVGKIVLTI
jgi:NADPH:quinone reductase-like Zn-dependent oxidoreductase